MATTPRRCTDPWSKAWPSGSVPKPLGPRRCAFPVRFVLFVLSALLRELPDLEELQIHNTPVNSLAPLASLTGLRRVMLDGTAVQDLSPLSHSPRMTYLSVRRSPVSDLSPCAPCALWRP